MPTYDYECSSCKHTFELFQSMTEAPKTLCPKCKKKKLKRLIGSGMGIIFKGTGFYETDYKRKASGSSKKSVSSASSADSGATAKTEPNSAVPASPAESAKPTAKTDKKD